MDKKYWSSVYQSSNLIDDLHQESSFAKFCSENYFKYNNMKIVELGCGTGRDAFYFASKLHNVIAIDQSIEAIESRRMTNDELCYDNLRILQDDFVQMSYSDIEGIDIIYSRFTLHSISNVDEDQLLPKVFNHLNKGGLFCVEARTVKDPLFGVGVKCGYNTYKTDHQRRFIESDEFIKKVLSLGFKIRYFAEMNNLSVYKTDNPVLMRVIMER